MILPSFLQIGIHELGVRKAILRVVQERLQFEVKAKEKEQEIGKPEVRNYFKNQRTTAITVDQHLVSFALTVPNCWKKVSFQGNMEGNSIFCNISSLWVHLCLVFTFCLFVFNGAVTPHHPQQWRCNSTATCLNEIYPFIRSRRCTFDPCKQPFSVSVVERTEK